MNALYSADDEGLEACEEESGAEISISDNASRAYNADSFTPGNRITFGTYPQTKDGTDKTPIEWLVLDHVGDSVMLISQYKLDMQPYNTTDENASWETCSLRAWLNDSFLNTAFTSDEQTALLESATDKETKDLVTLLTPQEAKSYFDNSELCNVPMTEYAGILLDRTGKTGADFTDIMGSTSWPYWLRNTGYKSNETAEVNWFGEVVSRSNNASYSMNLVRPVIYINTGASLFHQEGRSMSPESTKVVKESKINATDYVIGKSVYFGSWPQTESGNDRTPIEWQVIGRRTNQVLLLSRYALDILPLHMDGDTTTWERSTLRTWLNEEFLNSAFSRSEQAQLLVTPLDNTGNTNKGKDVSSGKNTLDRIFLISYSDLMDYLPRKDTRLCNPTAYAVKKWAIRNLKSSSDTTDSTVNWWLRSMQNKTNAYLIKNDGDLITLPASSDFNVFVRPAVWITLDPGSYTCFVDDDQTYGNYPEDVLSGMDESFNYVMSRLPNPEPLQISSTKKLAIYTAPSTKSIRTQKNKAAYQPDNSIEVYGQADSWLMIRTVQENGKPQVGYIQSKDLIDDLNAIGNLHFDNIHAGVCRDTALYEAPDSNSEKVTDLTFGAEALFLASVKEWANVETTVGSKTARGFVPRQDILLSLGKKLQPTDCTWTSGSGEKIDSGMTVDSNPETALLIPVEEYPTTGTFVYTFETPISLDRMVLWNGYWKTEKKKDQYEQYSRLDTVEISFLYEGSTNFTDSVRLIIPETKNWEKRSDGIYINLTGHENVTAVRITPVSIIKGKKYKTEIAISEIAFYDH